MNEEISSRILSELAELRKDISALSKMVMAIETNLNDRIYKGKPPRGPRTLFELRQQIEECNEAKMKELSIKKKQNVMINGAKKINAPSPRCCLPTCMIKNIHP